MKILLINPPLPLERQFGSFVSSGNIIPPLGLGYIASVLLKNGFNPKIIDCVAENINHNQLNRIIKKGHPDLVFITAHTISINSAKKVAEDTKRSVHDCFVVVGGVHITALPKETMMYSSFDIGVIGEGELTSLEIAKQIDKQNLNFSNIDGVIYKDGKKFHFTKPRKFIRNLDTLPFPVRHLFPPMNIYKPTPASYKKLPFAHVITTRGCPYNCKFCDKKVFGSSYREHSSEYVLDEIDELIRSYGVKEIRFFDDCFTLNKKRILEICKGIRKRKFDIKWTCLTRVDNIDNLLLKEMHKAGCWQVLYGIESGDQRMLDIMDKGIKIKQIVKAVNLAKLNNLDVRADFLIGAPGETIYSINKTINFAIKLDLDVANFNLFTPLPGSLFYNEIKDKLMHKNYDHYNMLIEKNSILPYTTDALNELQLKKAIRKAHRKFYLRPGYILKQLIRVRNLEDIKRNYSAINSILRT